jgi:type II secretory pathway pseudopilin PulG
MKKQNCFTLVELVIVILILAVVGIYFAMRWPGFTFGVSNTAYVLADTLRTAQQAAISRNAFLQVKINPSGYGIYFASSQSDTTNTTLYGSYAPFQSGITECSCTSSYSGTCYLGFDNLGMAYAYNGSGGSYSALTANFTINICANDRSKNNIIINQAGGVLVQ